MVKLEVVGVQVGRPRPLTRRRGRMVDSAIAKHPVTTDTISIGRTNLDGDQQADLRVHGGVEKAVYAYPTEHLEYWSEQLGLALTPGAFGENLSVVGALEADVHIGDRWAWGDALLEISRPRGPCYKLVAHLDRPEIIEKMVANGKTGWYLRVIEPGEAPVGGPMALVDRDLAQPTVLSAHRVRTHSA